MTLVGEPLWVRVFVAIVFVAFVMSVVRAIVKWR